MIRDTFAQLRRLASVALVAGVATFSGTANAIVFVGNWDPLFNFGFDTDLGWRGKAEVSVSNDCLAPSNWGFVVDVVGTCSAALTKVELDFYQHPDVPPTPFAPDLTTVGPFSPVTRIALKPDGKLDAIEAVSFVVSPVFAHPLIDAGGLWQAELQFILNAAGDEPFTLASPYGPVLTLKQVCFGEGEGVFPCGLPVLSDVNNPPTVTWVPEPGILALVGVAMLGVGWSRRRAHP